MYLGNEEENMQTLNVRRRIAMREGSKGSSQKEGKERENNLGQPRRLRNEREDNRIGKHPVYSNVDC